MTLTRWAATAALATLCASAAAATMYGNQATTPPLDLDRMEVQEIGDLANGSLAGADLVTRSILHDLEGMEDGELDAVHQSFGVLMTNCPYNRTSAQLPIVMQRVLARHDPGILPPEAATAYREVQDAVNHHVALISALGGLDAAETVPGDYLHGIPSVLSAAQLAAHPQPEQATKDLLRDLQPLADALDGVTQARLEWAHEPVGEATRQMWPMKRSMLGYRDTLRRVIHASATCRDDTCSAPIDEVDFLLTLIDDYANRTC